MKDAVSEYLFETREDFRTWLCDNATTSNGIWLIFGKTNAVVTLSANDALEEALCFGWIDGQMKRIDDTKYRKYFACRRPKSPWSEKNKNIIKTLVERNLMTNLGNQAVEVAKQNGMWDASPSGAISEEQIDAFRTLLSDASVAHENFINMPRSAKVAYVRRYLSFKNEDTRQRDFQKIIQLLNENLKPTIGKS